ncbi:MAG: hypothetical protein HY879_03675 [Deltaproteobacteria bacterium]|nr:hypothetical protein [Deltaproteobacteria bacterium]
MKWFKKTPFSLWAIILGYGLLNIPFLFSGFGEPDGWRNGLAALGWAQDLGYIPSRFPGFPVVELAYGVAAKLFPWESFWIYTNLVTLFITMIGIYFFFQIAHYHKISQLLTTVLLLFFIPVVFINASSSMDYLWTATFILISYWALLQNKAIIGGLSLGLAIGARLTTGIFLPAFLLFLVWNEKVFTKKTVLRGTLLFVCATLFISLGAYFPLLWRYHLNFLETLYPPRDFIRSGYYVMQWIFGLPGWIFFLFWVFKKRKGFMQWNWEFYLWGFIIAAYLVLFLVKPEKVEYLIPMFPFAVLWIARWLNGKHLTILTCLVIGNNLISFLVFQPGPQGLKMEWVDKGTAFQKYAAYKQYIGDNRFLVRYPYLPNSVVVVGWYEPGIEYFLELPANQTRKNELLKNRIQFSHNSGCAWRKNTYLVEGPSREKEGDPALVNAQVIRLPSMSK